ncbi:MAG: hypothetical protein CND66_05510 [Marine Group II euryarchaeote MED-G37]|jgi:hypothetical protein|nr:MAG: hypothetical protein CND66_05510 [Marine Group II euryarchaeote MED-G37]
MDSEPVISAMRAVPQVILLTTKGRGIAPHVGSKKKIPSTRVLMKLEPKTGRLRQSGRDRSTAEKKDLYLLGLCHLGKIEEET